MDENNEQVSTKIRRHLGDFSRSERQVARTLLDADPTAGLDSQAVVAKLAKVSGATVSRFVTRLGFENYAEFQHAVRRDLVSKTGTPLDFYPQGVESGDSSDLVSAQIEMLTGAIADTLRGIRPEDLETVSDLLGDRRRRIVVYGGWFSHILARHLFGLLQEIRRGVEFVDSSASHRVSALSDADHRCVAVVFDFQRYEGDTERFGRGMAREGAKLILFTDQNLSPLSDIADVVLPAYLGIPSPFESYTAALALVETVVARTVQKTVDAGRPRFEKFSRVANELVPSWEPLHGIWQAEITD